MMGSPAVSFGVSCPRGCFDCSAPAHPYAQHWEPSRAFSKPFSTRLRKQSFARPNRILATPHENRWNSLDCRGLVSNYRRCCGYTVRCSDEFISRGSLVRIQPPLLDSILGVRINPLVAARTVWASATIIERALLLDLIQSFRGGSALAEYDWLKNSATVENAPKI